MGVGRLTELQERILSVLSDMEPPWTLTGGGALAGFHLRHRTTRDLGLFWHDTERLGDRREACVRRLRAAGLRVESIQHEPAFERLSVSDENERMVVDLVAEPVASIQAPQSFRLGEHTLLVDTAHEILVNKLCALLGRAEIRDLIDLGALLAAGGDLDQALGEAPRKDAGFSAATLGWVLEGMPVDDLGRGAGLEEEAIRELATLRDDLVHRLVRGTGPA